MQTTDSTTTTTTRITFVRDKETEIVGFPSPNNDNSSKITSVGSTVVGKQETDRRRVETLSVERGVTALGTNVDNNEQAHQHEHHALTMTIAVKSTARGAMRRMTAINGKAGGGGRLRTPSRLFLVEGLEQQQH